MAKRGSGVEVTTPITLSSILEPFEKVILDNEEKSTTWAETGSTGLLLGTVKLPAPKNQIAIAAHCLLSFEAKYEVDPGKLLIRIFDGSDEYDRDWLWNNSLSWGVYRVISSIVASENVVEANLKGVETLELRFYLIGSTGYPNAKQYCRNLVVTVMPLYRF